MSEPRVPPVIPGTRPELAALEEQILRERGRISTLYRVLLNSAPIAQGWEAMLTAVRSRASLPARIRELVILRIAMLNHAGYEFDAHVPHAQKAGVPDAAIAALKTGGISPALATDGVRSRLTSSGADPAPSTPAELTSLLKQDMAKRGKLIRDKKIKGE